jgi:hypothetical protein
MNLGVKKGPLTPSLSPSEGERVTGRREIRVTGPERQQFVGRNFSLAVFLCLVAGSAAGDQVQMQNGDQYGGQVISITSDTLVLQSDILGTLRLPRGKIAVVNFGPLTATNSAVRPALTNQSQRALPTAFTNTAPDLSAVLRQLGTQTNLIRQVQDQLLAGAGPEANAKFNDLLAGLMSGKLNVNNLRTEARSVADQVRAARKDLGDDAGDMLDTYLAVLDAFLKETAPSGGPAAKAPAAAPKPRTAAGEEE